MPVVCKVVGDDILLGVWKITESVDELLELYCEDGAGDVLPFGFKSECRCSEWLASRLLVRNLLGENVSVLNDDNGKPFISGSSLYVSLSHTKGYAVAAVSNNVIGIDVELRKRKALAARERFMNIVEVSSNGSFDENTIALLHWSAKEALFKVVGNLGGNFKDNITVQPFEMADKGVLMLHLHGVDSNYAGIYPVKYIMGTDLLMTLCGSFLFDDKELLRIL